MISSKADRKQPEKQQLTVPLLMGLALLSASAPFSTDMYLPALPGIVDDLATTQPMVQLTLSGFLAGLAFGQLIIGPISDAMGRRRLMFAGATVALIASIAAAIAPNVGILILARLIQGLGSGACIVLARAVVPDLARGAAAAKAFALLMTIQGLAPVLAPMVGGLLVGPLGWRGLFWVLAAIAFVQFLVVAFVIDESRPPEERSPANVRDIVGNYAFVLANPGYRGYLVAFALAFTAMFSYISASPFLFQQDLGFSVQGFSFVFALNGAGIVCGSFLNSRLIGRVSTHRLLICALSAILGSSILLLLVMAFYPVTWLIMVLLFIAVAQIGIIMGNATALGTGLVRERAGAASALMGFTQFGLAGLISPLMGAGENVGLAMALSMSVCSLLALIGAIYAGRYGTTAAPKSVS
ncbi:multidrug effflux MFS transporter [Corynebacterium alimapuense]|uniref:Bcr/CflA family drug resistance efflux transporter n=1 Tax=Corynebacterium alimapuense TaxID=1576874 RepID=A0A3M8K9L8_9CORY|nr:multidrug effflux MFS transporter [Corynebacterium alimapuense]RNE49913.1 Bcr/CflA family drug resistance efflux transporter [Corynebacterium alimapuense]